MISWLPRNHRILTIL